MLQILKLSLVIIIWLLSRKTKYLKIATTSLFVYLAINIVSYFRIYPFVDIRSISQVETFVDDSIFQPGVVINTHRRQCGDPINIAGRFLYTMMTGDPFFHTALVVNYNNAKFVFHALPYEVYVKEKKGHEGVVEVGKKTYWIFFLEPLSLFLSKENSSDSIFKVTSTGKHIDYNEDIVRGIEKESVSYPLHCAYVIGKYLEGDGLVKNNTLFADVLYYHPKYFSEKFANERFLKLLSLV